jgi:hypothetical protein
MKRYALALAVILMSSTAHAENVVVGCPLVAKYSESSVSMLLSRARSVMSEGEINKIYVRYVSLKHACATNAKASSTLPVSAGLRQLLADYGVDVHSLGRQL